MKPSPEIRYGRFSRTTAFYNELMNIIYINEIVKNYPNFNKYTIKHEMYHYKNTFHKIRIFRTLLNIAVDWYAIYQINIEGYNTIRKDHINCTNEFLKLSFSEDEKQLNKSMIASFTLEDRFYQLIYDIFKPGLTGYWFVLATPPLITFNTTIQSYFLYFIVYTFLILLLNYLGTGKLHLQ